MLADLPVAAALTKALRLRQFSSLRMTFVLALRFDARVANPNPIGCWCRAAAAAGLSLDQFYGVAFTHLALDNDNGGKVAVRKLTSVASPVLGGGAR